MVEGSSCVLSGERECDVCGGAYVAKRPSSRFCGDRCRKRAQRQPRTADAPPVSAPAAVEGGVLGQVTAELGEVGRLDSTLGQIAVAIATRMAGFETGAGLAALSKELRAVMGEALGGAVTVADPVDELRSRRDLKRNAG